MVMDCIRERVIWIACHSLNLFTEYDPSNVDLPWEVSTQPVASEGIQITVPQAGVHFYV
jgi:hypothetical protein